MTTLEDRFKALDSDDQAAILDKHRDWNTDHDWWEFVYEGFVEKVKERGFTVDTRVRKTVKGRAYDELAIYFSGFCSQGDGACFEGWVSDWPTVLKDYPLLKKHHGGDGYGELSLSWASRGRDSHKHSLHFDDILGGVPDETNYDGLRAQAVRQIAKELEDEWIRFVEHIRAKVHDLCDDLYTQLEEEYEYLTSDEAILEALLSNEDILEDELKEYEDEHEESV